VGTCTLKSQSAPTGGTFIYGFASNGTVNGSFYGNNDGDQNYVFSSTAQPTVTWTGQNTTACGAWLAREDFFDAASSVVRHRAMVINQ